MNIMKKYINMPTCMLVKAQNELKNILNQSATQSSQSSYHQELMIINHLLHKRGNE